MDEIINKVQESLKNSKSMFLCPACAHKAVCKEMEIHGAKCEHFADATTYQRYSSIHHFFQPIFDWINFHYPAREVMFIVDHNSAKMVLEHGPYVSSKEINNALTIEAKFTDEIENANDKGEDK